MKAFDSWWRSSPIRAAGPIAVGVIWALVCFATAANSQGYGGGSYGGGQGYDGQGYGSGQGRGASGNGNRSQRCQDLERQLVNDWQGGNNPRDKVVTIEQQLADLERQRTRAEAEAEQRECYEDMFLFGRSLKRSPSCVRLDSEIETTRRNIANLRQQRDALTGRDSRRMRREDLVAELARAGCGENYSREAETQRGSSSSSSNPLFSLWQDNEDTAIDRSYANPQPQTNLPFTSYRTMCVRQCDGYYFPMSFSTLASHFKDDEQRCRESCAAPAELYVYKNPGEEVEQMVSLEGRPYNELKTAWRNRKFFVKGCSCKPEEYNPQEIAASEQALGKQAASGKTAGPSGQERGTVNKSPDEPVVGGAKGAVKPQ